MNNVTQDFMRPGYESQPAPDFPHAPLDWSRNEAEAWAATEALPLTEEHWQVVRALQAMYARPDATAMSMRELHDALDESFHAEGGIRHLYELFPKGPLAQGCQLAGLQPPAGTQDQGFGSAV